MSEKLVDIKTNKSTYRFRISESGGKYSVAKDTGTFFTSWNTIGTARSMDDALDLAKSEVDGTVRDIDIR
jgi:uncharacterized membrane protein YkoI